MDLKVAEQVGCRKQCVCVYVCVCVCVTSKLSLQISYETSSVWLSTYITKKKQAKNSDNKYNLITFINQSFTHPFA